jgi:ATPase subunit of ABC transporter with duplicated ATPase domains
MEGKEALAASLREYSGGLLLVSHDRQLIDSSCNRFWLIDDNGLSEWHTADEVYARLREGRPRSTGVSKRMQRLSSPTTMTPCWNG